MGEIGGEEYISYVRPLSDEEDNIYVDPISMSSIDSATNHKKENETETIYETPSPIPLTSAHATVEKNSENVKKTHKHTLMNSFQNSEAASALSKAWRFPKKMLSTDQLPFKKEAKKRHSSTPNKTFKPPNQVDDADDDVYVEAEDASKGHSQPPKIQNRKSSANEAITNEWNKCNSLPLSAAKYRSSLQSNELDDQSNNENLDALYLDFSNEVVSDQENSEGFSPAASNAEQYISMGGKPSKQASKENRRHGKQFSKKETSEAASNRYEVQTSTNRVLVGERASDSSPIPVSMPSCDPPEPPQFGHRPLPPTPKWPKTSAEELSGNAEYSDIDDNERQRHRKSSMPSQPPPLPPASTDENLVDKKATPKNPRSPTSPKQNPSSQIVEHKISGKWENSKEKSSKSSHEQKPHSIAKALKTNQHASRLKQLASGSNSQEREETKIAISKLKHQEASKANKDLSPPPSPPTYVNSPGAVKKPPSIPNKPPQYSSTNIRKKEASNAVDDIPKKPSRNLNKKTSSFTKSTSVAAELRVKEKSKMHASPKKTEKPSAKTESKQDSRNDKTALTVPNTKRVKGYTLHKLQAEKMDNQKKEATTKSFSSQKSIEISNPIDPDVFDNNTYHTIDDVDDQDREEAFQEKKKLNPSKSNSSAMLVEPHDNKSVSRSASQTSDTTLPRSPKIKTKPRPTVPPPPRPTASPLQAKETKRPPSRPPPPSKEKIAKAKLRRHLSSSNGLTISSTNESSPVSNSNRRKENQKERNYKFQNAKQHSNHSSMEKEGETYYSAVPSDSPGSPKSPRKFKEEKTHDVRHKGKNKLDFPSVANSILLVRSKFNKQAKQHNAEEEEPKANPSPGYWREDSFEDDDEDDIEGIYAGIDDDYPVKNDNSDDYLTSISPSKR